MHTPTAVVVIRGCKTGCHCWSWPADGVALRALTCLLLHVRPQVIDTQQQYLQNVITFPPDGAFIVNSSISIDGPQRTQFKFTSATLKLPSRSINVPPFGQGW
jgi:hypothetical protein